MYNPYVIGKTVYLRHPTKEDAEGRWHEWFSDEDTTRYLNERYWPNSLEQQQAFFQALSGSANHLVLSIVDRVTDTHIGVCSLSAINWVHRYADFAIVIGEKEYSRGTAAFESGSLLMRIAFKRLNLRIVKGAYLRCNEFTRYFTALAGFREVGVYEQLCWIDGRYVDLIHVMLTQGEWLERQGVRS